MQNIPIPKQSAKLVGIYPNRLLAVIAAKGGSSTSLNRMNAYASSIVHHHNLQSV